MEDYKKNTSKYSKVLLSSTLLIVYGKRREECRCLIHNAHFRKIPSFCKILDLKITHLKEIFE
jgi:hypothetical protein